MQHLFQREILLNGMDKERLYFIDEPVLSLFIGLYYNELNFVLSSLSLALLLKEGWQFNLIEAAKTFKKTGNDNMDSCKSQKLSQKLLFPKVYLTSFKRQRHICFVITYDIHVPLKCPLILTETLRLFNFATTKNIYW